MRYGILCMIAVSLLAGCETRRSADPLHVTLRPQAFSRFQAGMEKFLAGDMEAASTVWKRYVLSHPDAPETGEVYYWLGLAQKKQGGIHAACESFREACTHGVTPEMTGYVLYYLGHTLFETAQFDRAEDVFSELVEKYPGLEQEDMTYYRFGSCLRRRGLRKEAAKWFGLLQTLYPDSPYAGPSQHKAQHADDRYEIQLGAYSVYARASEKVEEYKRLPLISRLNKQPRITRVSRNGVILHCVRIGYFATWDEANQVKQRLAGQGYDAIVLP